MAHGLERIDWASPWLVPWRATGKELADLTDSGLSCADALNEGNRTKVVRFVEQTRLPAAESYEAFIFRTQQVPTRDGLHDFFNGLCWVHFPLTKRRLNALQASHITKSGIQSTRGPARDGLTVFDENAAIFQGPDALWDALTQKDWKRVFITLRPLWLETHILLFGHALLEKLVTPRKPITAHIYRAHAGSNGLAAIDAWLAHDLSAEKLAAKPFAHLPILGVPGWWPDNTHPDFYSDASVFRSPTSEINFTPL